jgi:hypothetical protein
MENYLPRSTPFVRLAKKGKPASDKRQNTQKDLEFDVSKDAGMIYSIHDARFAAVRRIRCGWVTQVMPECRLTGGLDRP